jgi:hypothetical protein
MWGHSGGQCHPRRPNEYGRSWRSITASLTQRSCLEPADRPHPLGLGEPAFARDPDGAGLPVRPRCRSVGPGEVAAMSPKAKGPVKAPLVALGRPCVPCSGASISEGAEPSMPQGAHQSARGHEGPQVAHGGPGVVPEGVGLNPSSEAPGRTMPRRPRQPSPARVPPSSQHPGPAP